MYKQVARGLEGTDWPGGTLGYRLVLWEATAANSYRSEGERFSSPAWKQDT